MTRGECISSTSTIALEVLKTYTAGMLCFRDMTFCAAKCATAACPRQFDNKQKVAADRWWGKDGAPVAFSDFSSNCPEYVPLEKPHE